MQALTFSPTGKQLIGVFADQGKGGAVFRDAGFLFFAEAGTWQRYALGPGDTAAIAFRGDHALAVAIRTGGTLSVRVANFLSQLDTTTPATLSAGSDLAVGFGREGWAYVATGGAISRLNPDSLSFEPWGGYSGEARRLMRTLDGTALLLASTGVYRLDPSGSTWSLVLDGGFTGISIWGDRVVVAYGDSRSWYVIESPDAGRSWSGAVRAATNSQCDCMREPYPMLSENVIEVAGVVVEPAGGLGEPYEGDMFDPSKVAPPGKDYPFAVLFRQSGGEWYPAEGSRVYEALTRNTTEIRPTNAMQCVSSNHMGVCGLEVIQNNGQVDVIAITR